MAQDGNEPAAPPWQIGRRRPARAARPRSTNARHAQASGETRQTRGQAPAGAADAGPERDREAAENEKSRRDQQEQRTQHEIQPTRQIVHGVGMRRG